MATANDEKNIITVSFLLTGQEFVNSDLIETKEGTPDTSSQFIGKGQSVPSASLEGQVWLSYTPKTSTASVKASTKD